MTVENSQQSHQSTPPTPESSFTSRRRSWFGLNSPTASSSSPRKTSVKNSQLVDDAGVEVLEMDEVSPSTRSGLNIIRTPNSKAENTNDTRVELQPEDLDNDMGLVTVKKSTKREPLAEAYALQDLSLSIQGSSDATPTQAKIFRHPFGRTASDRDMYRVVDLSDTGDPEATLQVEPKPIHAHFRSPSKPLPPLPGDDNMPREIVVTPSSPRNATQKIAQSFDDIGIGKSLIIIDGKPPLPAKQSVSSPLPNREPNSTSRISFGTNTPRGRSSSRDEESQTIKGKRARSLSGMFNRLEEGRDRLQSSGSLDISDGESGRPQGMFGWLGVRKTIKRRPSDVKLRSNDSTSQLMDSTLSDAFPSRAQSLETTTNGSKDISSVASSSFVLPPVEKSAPLWMPSSTGLTTSPTAEIGEPVYGSEQWHSPSRPWVESADGSHRSSISSTSSPLEPLPGTGTTIFLSDLHEAVDCSTRADQQERRLRSWSDAPVLAPPSFPPDSLSLPSPPLRPVHSSSLRASTPPRPYLGSRNNSGSSVVMDKVRNVFSKNNRNRSNSLLRYDGDVDEAGNHLEPSWAQASQTITSSSSSPITSPVLPPVRIRHESISQDESQSPRSSYAASFSSRTTHTNKPIPVTHAATRHARARASTVSSIHGPPAPRPSSPSLMPIIGTPPRNRPRSLRRMSNGLFKTGTSPKNGSLFPLPPRSSGSISSSGGMSPREDAAFGNPTMSPRPSVGSLSGTNGSAHGFSNTKPLEDESAEDWVHRLSGISRRDLASVLAASGDSFHLKALGIYMNRFDFTHSSLDISLRRLLMHMSLPRETQQIDRIVEAFAKRYDECEPGLFQADGNSYVLAFSMMMLHTDAFNRNNKNKMTKADYVRNTRLDGVPPIVLESFYDNITFTPFVFIEDEGEYKQQEFGMPGASLSTTTSIRSNKIDVYDLIVKGRISALRVDVERLIPAESPFSCTGTETVLESEGFHRYFSQAYTLQVAPNRPRRKSSVAALQRDRNVSEKPITLRITKVGLISRKDEKVSGGKRTSARKWKSWSVILTSSQLVFFKDTMWALSLQEQIQAFEAADEKAPKPFLQLTSFKPDEVFSLQGCIAVFDSHYKKYPNTFRFITPHGQNFLMQASDEADMNHWLGLINFASTFKTANIHMRAGGMGSDQAVLAGAAAAASHRRDIQTGGIVTTTLLQSSVSPNDTVSNLLHPSRKLSAELDTTGSDDVAPHSGEQLEAVFGVVKAELAAGRGGATKIGDDSRSAELISRESPTKRGDLVFAQLEAWKESISSTEKRLSSNLRVARNLAILTPFQKSTRDRIESALPQIARDIRNDRIILAKLRTWSAILQDDFEWEQRDWARVRHVALQAAATSLRNPEGVQDVVRKVNQGENGFQVPRLDLPVSEEKNLTAQDSSLNGHSANQRHSSLGEDHVLYKFDHSSTSDLDEAYDPRRRPSSEYISASSMMSPEDELTEYQLHLEEDETPQDQDELGSGAKNDLKDNREEEAEEWQNTRAAKRVSLATIPPDELRELSQKMSYLETVADVAEK